SRPARVGKALWCRHRNSCPTCPTLTALTEKELKPPSCEGVSGSPPLLVLSDLADPVAVFPNGFEGGEITAVEDVFGGGEKMAFFEIVEGVAGADGDELENARIAIAVDHATSAAVANEL